MDKSLEIRILNTIIEEFNKHNISYWVTDGTALKLYRDNKIFPSSDFDFAMFSDEIPKVLLVCNELEKQGFSVGYQNRLPFVEDFIIIYPPESCAYGPISFNFYHIFQNEAFARNFNHPFRKEKLLLKLFTLGYKLQDNKVKYGSNIIHNIISLIPITIRKLISYSLFNVYEILAKTYWVVVPLRFFNSLKRVKFMGLELFIPEDIESFLEYRYGPNWKTPIKNWNKFECQHIRIRKLNTFKPKKYIVFCKHDLEDHKAADVFSFSDDEINQIQLRDLRSF
jgi:phosphorylcholine metabolism protein LicD